MFGVIEVSELVRFKDFMVLGLRFLELRVFMLLGVRAIMTSPTGCYNLIIYA